MSYHYKPLKTLALLAIAGLAMAGVLDLLSALQGVALWISPEMALDLDEGGQTSVWLLLYGLIALFKIPILLATIVLFLCWLYRAHANLEHLRPTHLEFTPGWAVGWWFIPFLNLVRPYQVVREVWWESNPEVPEEQPFLSASLHSAPTYVGLWWAAWIISNIFDNISSRIYDLDSMQNLSTFGTVAVISGVLGAVAAILAIMVVRDITDRQEKRRIAIGETMSDVPPPPPTFGPGS